MTQYQLTVDNATLQHPFGGDGQMSCLLEQILYQVLEAQATEQL